MKHEQIPFFVISLSFEHIDDIVGDMLLLGQGEEREWMTWKTPLIIKTWT